MHIPVSRGEVGPDGLVMTPQTREALSRVLATLATAAADAAAADAAAAGQ